jgi:hypothetical protein
LREFRESDLKWFYAAHAMETGERLEDIRAWFVARVAAFDALYVVEGEKLIGMGCLSGADGPRSVRAWWMPWASKRDKLTAALTFFQNLRYEMTLLAIIPDDDKLLKHLERYGVLRKVGTIERFHGAKDSDLYQSRIGRRKRGR